jgi:hypothetical protein
MNKIAKISKPAEVETSIVETGIKRPQGIADTITTDQTPLQLIGKVVAVRGHASGVNVGVCTGIGSTWIMLGAPFYYMKHWEWDKSKGCFGCFHALSYGNITRGVEIAKVPQPCVIYAFQHVIECIPDLMGKIDKFSSM